MSTTFGDIKYLLKQENEKSYDQVYSFIIKQQAKTFIYKNQSKVEKSVIGIFFFYFKQTVLI